MDGSDSDDGDMNDETFDQLNINIKILNLTESLVIFNHLIWGFLLILGISLCNF